jgi:uncharacterized protein
MTISDKLIHAIVPQLAVNPFGFHGLGHWARVYENGLRLAGSTGADIQVVELFALFHDSRRLNENGDPDHGPRGAMLAEQLRGTLFLLDDKPYHLLLTACRLHTAERTHEDLTVQTCFDADRLDLARTGRTVDPHFLCTETARDSEIIAWSTGQSTAGIVPDNIIGRALRSITR